MRLTELLTAHNVPFRTSGHHHCTRGWISVDCPFCSSRDDGKWRMGLNASHLAANCWKCGPQNAYVVMQTLLGVNAYDLRQLLQGLVPEKVQDEVKVGGVLLTPFTTTPLRDCPYHQHYLIGRKFVPEEIERLWQVQAIKLHSEYAWRLYIPVIFRGEVVSWTTRAIQDDVKAKYLTAKPAQEKVHIKKILYAEDYARNSVVVCEGPTDVWRVGPGAVCTFGTGFTAAQVRRIARYPKRTICFDSEVQAQWRANRLADELSVLPGETTNVVLDAKDPGSAKRSEIEKLRKIALD